MKNEANGKIIPEFVGLTPKINTSLVDNENDSTKIFKKAQGIKKSIQRNYIMHKEHVDVLIKQMKQEVNNFVSKFHRRNTCFFQNCCVFFTFLAFCKARNQGILKTINRYQYHFIYELIHLMHACNTHLKTNL